MSYRKGVGDERPTFSSKDLDEILDMDPATKLAFLGMSREQQMLAIIGMQAYQRQYTANLEKRVISLEQNIERYRVKREEREKKLNDVLDGIPSAEEMSKEELMNTTQKVMNVLSSRLAPWTKLFFGVLQTVITVIVLAILALAFGVKLPTP